MKTAKKVARIAMAPFYLTTVGITGAEEIIYKSLGYVTGSETLKKAGEIASDWRESALDLMMGKEI